MPYLPRVHLKGKKGPGFRYGLGLCYKARCICIPDKKAPCKQLIWDTNSLLSLVLGLNISLFFTGLWAQQVAQSHHEARVGGWSLSSCLIRMSTLSLPGLWDGQWSALFLSAFYHRGFLEFIRNMALLANVLEGAAQYGSWMFLALYIGGSVAHFVGACAALRVLGPEWLVPLEAWLGTHICFIDEESRRTVSVFFSVFNYGLVVVSSLIAMFVTNLGRFRRAVEGGSPASWRSSPR
ncbi:unnamed protein product [Polarella glacialis]|uniref:Uncharacterized protein n=1 Tax=Polarella glacialis TaxID=89957 RepID=A0A813DNI3_POLGL|nr:unnamed protein product [Polarella glacialis]